jgi:DNA-binding transcriptional ArsR family regulator
VTRPADAGAGAIFAALADDTRRTVLGAVSRGDGATATELTEVVPISRQAVAKHLGVLRDAGLVEAERVGRETRYRARPGALRPAAIWLAEADAAWSDRLARLKRQAESP